MSTYGCYENRETRTGKSLAEEITIFRNFECSNGSTEDLDTETLEDTHLVELNSDVESGLSTESEEDTVWSLFFKNVGNVIGSDGED